MSEFKKYAVKANAVARDALDKIKASEDALEAAERCRNDTRDPRTGRVDAVKAARAEADFLEARATRDRILQELPYATKSKLAAIRRELAAALNSEFSADPAKLDTRTVELLKSGILRSEEYARLMNDARAAGNTVMSRVIARYAATAAEEAEAKYGFTDRRAMELRAVAVDGEGDGENAVADKLAAFDVITEAFNLSASNTSMISDWEQLTDPIIANF